MAARDTRVPRVAWSGGDCAPAPRHRAHQAARVRAQLRARAVTAPAVKSYL